ncbi:hypothetical protein RYX36_007217, partial [Vicia faba]
QQQPETHTLNQNLAERDFYMEKLGIANGFPSSNFEEAENVSSAHSPASSNKLSAISRAQVSAPPESPKSISENSLSPFEFHLHRAFKHHLPLHLLNHFSEPPFSTFPYSLVITIHLHAITATHLHYQESLISNFIFLLSHSPLTHSSPNFCHSSTSPSANQRSIATPIHESVTHVKHRKHNNTVEEEKDEVEEADIKQRRKPKKTQEYKEEKGNGKNQAHNRLKALLGIRHWCHCRKDETRRFTRRKQRQEEKSEIQTLDVHPSYAFSQQQPESHTLNQNLAERDFYMEKLGIANGFPSSNFEEAENVSSAHSPASSNKLSAISRAQVSAPPGFSIPSRLPPPDFSSHERSEHTFDSLSGNSLLDHSSFFEKFTSNALSWKY